MLYNSLIKIPFGKTVFAWIVCQRIPYFKSIRPKVVEIKEGRTVVSMKERRSIQNHVKTVHAIALCNLCELSMAMTAEATIPDHLRFIPVGMTVAYKKKAKGVLIAISEIKKADFKPGNVNINVDVFDEGKINVMSAVITLNIKEK